MRIVLRLAVLLALLGLGACKKEVQFTRVPFIGANEADLRPTQTHVFLEMPADVSALVAAADAALGPDVVRAREFIDDMACDRRRGTWIECMGATVTTELTRAGPLRISADGSRLIVNVPLRYDISARGHGWTSYLVERKTGTVTVGVPFEVGLSTGYRLDARPVEALVWNEKSIPVLKGKVDLGRLADARIKARLKDLASSVRQVVAPEALEAGTERAWKALHTPLDLGDGLWLRGQPERISGAGFAESDGTIVYRMAFAARLAVHPGARPPPLFVGPLPRPDRPGALGTPSETVLSVPMDLRADSLGKAVAEAFPATDVLETRPDTLSPVLKVRVTEATLFPSRDRLGLELQLDIVEPRRLFGMTGKAYLLARPVYDPVTGILAFRDIGFPVAPPREQKATPGLLRIGEEPFAGRLASVAHLEIGEVVRAFLPRINGQMARAVEGDMDLVGALTDLAVRSVDPVKGGFRINLELSGSLSLRPAGIRRTTGSLQPTGDRGTAPSVR